VRTGRLEASADPAPASHVSLKGLHILVVDDDRESLELLDAILGQAGAAVRLSASAAEGLRAYDDHPPDVIISDLEMPGEDGLAFMRQIRTREAGGGARVPTIALTGYGRVEGRVPALQAGFNLHIPRP